MLFLQQIEPTHFNPLYKKVHSILRDALHLPELSILYADAKVILVLVYINN